MIQVSDYKSHIFVYSRCVTNCVTTAINGTTYLIVDSSSSNKYQTFMENFAVGHYYSYKYMQIYYYLFTI